MNITAILLAIIFVYFINKQTNRLSRRYVLLTRKDDISKKLVICKQELSKMDRHDYKEHHRFWIQQWEFELQCIDKELKKLPKK